jgi:LPPG:FO 2-phospho-L-lactate transferase
MLRSGISLTLCTRALCERFGVRAGVLPMADTPVATQVETSSGTMHFQEYWVKHRGKVAVRDVVRCPPGQTRATPEVRAALGDADAIVIGPSNPVTSISPILECDGVPEALSKKFVLAISPFIGDVPVSGPAADLMRAWGRRADSAGIAEMYHEWVDIFVQDIRDPVTVPQSIRLDTLMTDREMSIQLSRAVFAILDENS